MDFRNHPPNQGPHGLWATSTFPIGGKGKWNYGGHGEGMLGWISREKAYFLFHQDFTGSQSGGAKENKSRSGWRAEKTSLFHSPNLLRKKLKSQGSSEEEGHYLGAEGRVLQTVTQLHGVPELPSAELFCPERNKGGLSLTEEMVLVEELHLPAQLSLITQCKPPASRWGDRGHLWTRQERRQKQFNKEQGELSKRVNIKESTQGRWVGFHKTLHVVYIVRLFHPPGFP